MAETGKPPTHLRPGGLTRVDLTDYQGQHRQMTAEDIDTIKIDPDWKVMRRMRDIVTDAVAEDIEELAMDLIGNHPKFDTGLIDNDQFMDGPMCHLEDRILAVLSDMLTRKD